MLTRVSTKEMDVKHLLLGEEYIWKWPHVHMHGEKSGFQATRWSMKQDGVS